jgi:hypothetical protein
VLVHQKMPGDAAARRLAAAAADFGPASVQLNDQRLVACDPCFAEGPVANAMQDTIAVVRRGGNVNFVEKVLRVQAAGAVGCVLIDFEDVGDGPPVIPKAGVASRSLALGVRIPSVCITWVDGEELLKQLPTTCSVVTSWDPEPATGPAKRPAKGLEKVELGEMTDSQELALEQGKMTDGQLKLHFLRARERLEEAEAVQVAHNSLVGLTRASLPKQLARWASRRF